MNKSYNVPEFFAGYPTADLAPEGWLQEHVVEKLPPYVKCIVDFGCAAGRNFIPFCGASYNYIGLDIHPSENIKWLCTPSPVYYTLSLRDFMHHYEGLDIDWALSLVMTHGTLMYCDSSDEQNRFIDLLQQLGCKNFVFHEYASDILIRNGNLSERARCGKLGYLDLNAQNKKLFISPSFRDEENDMRAFISLEQLYKTKNIT